MSRLNKAEEIIKLAMLFQNSYCGLTVDDIASEFECSRRSAERMKALLFDLFPDKIEEVQTSDKKKRWRFVKGTMNFLISFTSTDFANLIYLKNITTDENRKKLLDELIEKIKALTPQKKIQSIYTDVSALMESEGFAIRQYSRAIVNPVVLDKLRNSMLAFKKVKFKYPVNEDTKTITLDPYGLIISDKYYFVGFNQYVNDLRLYKVDKIRELEVLNEYFLKEENFSLKEYCANSFGIYQEDPIDVVLEFDKSVAEDVLNYHFHPTQKMKELKNGNIEVKFTTGGTHAICQELFKWGCNVKIKKSQKLKEIYIKYLQSALNNF